MGLNIESYTKDIATAATAENLVKDGGGTTEAQEIYISCPAGNTSDLLLGASDSQDVIIPKGTTLPLKATLNRMGYTDTYDLTKIFVKAGTDGDDVGIMIISRDV